MESGRSLGILDGSNASGFRVVPNEQREILNNLGVTNNEFRDMRENPELFSFALESGKNSNAHGVMVDMYSRTGFEPVAKVRFNSEYAPEGWNFDELGEPYICVMAHNGESVDDIVRNMADDTYTKYSQDYLDSLPKMEYDDAIAYRDQILADRYAKNEGGSASKKAAYLVANADLKSPSPYVQTGPELTADSNIKVDKSNVNMSSANNMYEGLPFDAPETQQTSIPFLGDNLSGSIKNVNPDGTYVSRTATNTLRNSELVKSVEGAMDDLEKGIKNGDFNIEPVTEKESIQRAADALDKDYAGELRRLISETWTNGSRDVDEGMIILENKLKEAL